MKAAQQHFNFLLLLVLVRTTTGFAAATFSDANWTTMGSQPGANGPVFATAVDSSGNLYIGGSFSTVGNVFATNIAKWNGSSWSALGGGVNSVVRALAVSGSDLYVGGRFNNAGGIAANYIARWNGNNWSVLGSGMNEEVRALAAADSILYAGGDFTTAGGSAADSIANWDGSNWSALDTGMQQESDRAHGVRALVLSGSDLYAGGYFTNAGGIAANYIAKWNGGSWSALGSGMGGSGPWSPVYALAMLGNDLYAGGYFTTAGGIPADYIAKWNGSTWSALGSGIGPWVDALAIAGSDLYAGGNFTKATASGNANYIAKWDGNSWSTLGSGMNTEVFALAVSGSDLYAGGLLTTAGGKASSYIARAYLERPTLSILRSGDNITLSWPTFYETYALQQNSGAANANGWSSANYPLNTNGATKSAAITVALTNQFFRLIGIEP